MQDADRFKLLHGPYRAPRFRYGATVACQAYGLVKVVGVTSARIPWPVSLRGSSRVLVLYGSLVRAVRRESNQAVAYWWGVSGQTVTKWRKALSVATTNEGTWRLRSEYALEEPIADGRKLAWTKARDPVRRAKIAASRLGKKRPPHVIEAIRKAHLGKKHSPEVRAKMSAAHRRRGTRPPKAGRPWTAAEDAIVRSLPAAEVVQKTGRPLSSVYGRRRELGMPDGRTRNPSSGK
jgi:hypothetical protein